jgi:hypothetical protein
VTKYFFISTIVLGALIPLTSFADTVAWEWLQTGAEVNGGDWTFGQVFAPVQNISVDLLGYYSPSGGMLDSHPVSIWDTNGTLIATSVETASSVPFTAHFLYNSISPVTLFAGQIYEITGESGFDSYAYGDAGFAVQPAIDYFGYNYCLGCGDSFTGIGTVDLGIGDGFWGPDFGWGTTTSTPEPSTVTLVTTCAVGLAWTLRRKAVSSCMEVAQNACRERTQ